MSGNASATASCIESTEGMKRTVPEVPKSGGPIASKTATKVTASATAATVRAGGPSSVRSLGRAMRSGGAVRPGVR